MSQILKLAPNASIKIYTKRILKTLENGGVVAYPTDTYYGLGVSPFNKKGICKIFEIKSRDINKPLLVLVASKTQLNQLTRNHSLEANLIMKEFWPAPLSLIFNAVPELPDILTAKTGKIGIRMPGNKWTRSLLEAIECPLTATSANKSNQMNLCTAEEVQQALGNDVDLIIDPGPAPGENVSTLLDTTVSPPIIIRHGAITQQEIESRIAEHVHFSDY